MNRLKFNNLVVSNKKQVQEARKQIINKLVHKLRKFRAKDDKEDTNNKFNQRLNKTIQCLEHFKKMKVLEMVQQVLLFEKTPSAVLTNGEAVPDEMVTAMLADNKKMAELAVRFKKELNLRNDRLQWKDSIMEVSKRREKINRTEEKRRQRQELKLKKSMAKKREEWLQNNQKDTKEKEDAVTDTTMADDDKFEGAAGLECAVQIEQAGDTSLEMKINEPRKTKNTNNTNEPEMKEERKDQKKGVRTKRELSKNKLKAEKRVRTSSPKPEKETEESALNAPLKAVRPLKKPVQKSKVVDSFFFTDSGDHYLSTAVDVAPNANNFEDSEQSSGHFTKSLKYNRQDKQSIRATTTTISNHSFTPTHVNDVKINEENLHPSWIAKQKMKPTIAAFQGTKITFDD